MAENVPDNPAPSDKFRTSRSLLQRARDQEPEAWRRLCSLYEPLVRHWCRRNGVADQDVDDVTQEVFATAAASLDKFRHSEPTDTFRGWLQGVTRHRVLEHFRRVRRNLAAVGGSDAQRLILMQPDPNLGDDREESEICNHMYRQILEFVRAEFEQRTWQMFWRSVIDSVPTANVASEMGVSSAAVRQARARVLRRIREETADLAV